MEKFFKIKFNSLDFKKTKNLLNLLFITIIGVWFIREVTGLFLFQNPTSNLLFNLITIFFAFLAVKKNLIKYKKRLFKIIAKKISFRKDWPLLIAILIFWVLFLSVINWDLPYHYHPGDDEYIIPSMHFSNGEIESALGNKDLSQNPLHDNQHLMYYILTPFFALSKWFGELFYSGEATYFFLARILNLLFATGIIFLTYLSSKILFNRKVATISVFILSISRIFLHFSLFMRSDIIVVFLVSVLLLLASLKIVNKKETYSIQGIILGLGLSLKPYFIIFFIIPLFLIVKDLYEKNKPAKSLSDITLVLSLNFLFFHFGRFYHNYIIQFFGAGFQNGIEHSATGHYGLYPSNDISLFKKLIFSFEIFSWFNGLLFSFVLVSSFLFILFLLLKKKRKSNYLLIAISLFPFWIIMGTRLVQGGKYFLPIYPITTVLISLFLYYFYNKKLSKHIALLISLIFLLNTATTTLIYVYQLNKPDIRTEAKKWIEKTLNTNNKITILGKVSWEKPPINKNDFEIIDLGPETEYIVVNISEYYKYKYYKENQTKFKDTDWYPEEVPTKKELFLSEVFFQNKKNFCFENFCFEEIKNFKKPQIIKGLDLKTYKKHPANWEVWSVTNPIEIKVYRKIF